MSITFTLQKIFPLIPSSKFPSISKELISSEGDLDKIFQEQIKNLKCLFKFT